MAGMLYLPRLFVDHCEAEGSKQSETIKVMEHRLLKVIINPAMIVTWLAGPCLHPVAAVATPSAPRVSHNLGNFSRLGKLSWLTPWSWRLITDIDAVKKYRERFPGAVVGVTGVGVGKTNR